MIGRDELIIDLAAKFSKSAVLEFLELRKRILLLEKDKQAAKEEYEDAKEESLNLKKIVSIRTLT